ncbi:HU family DNA-binding protein [Lactococcus sp. dk322]|uniref:HU family DNA-binding protein n=1 Tax=Lactococcus sp. dk322 TaxID=2603290 RepID=UPI0011C7028C|nr:HU family DNA-binding protein [Lactococcus sp. dk322]TXK45779.1 HU family DNA-binding protein [Lactococcus sp. dk322]
MAKKPELIASMADKSGLTKGQSEKALNALISVIAEDLSKYEKVQLMGFGTFETRERPARTGRNPQTGKPIEIAAATVPVFKAGKTLKDAVKKTITGKSLI